MLSKEEIEKAKEMLNNPKKEDLIEIIRIFKRNGIENYCITKNETMQTLLQYIDQLEQENNKQNKIIDLMAGSINSYDSQLDICYFKDKEHVKQHYEEYLEQYFEKKVEKLDDKNI